MHAFSFHGLPGTPALSLQFTNLGTWACDEMTAYGRQLSCPCDQLVGLGGSLADSRAGWCLKLR
jgi:hypothetical protein